MSFFSNGFGRIVPKNIGSVDFYHSHWISDFRLPIAMHPSGINSYFLTVNTISLNDCYYCIIKDWIGIGTGLGEGGSFIRCVRSGKLNDLL
jgi:hypothetical protein